LVASEEQEQEWKLELDCKRRVIDKYGIANLEDDANKMDESFDQTGFPTGGCVLRRVKEYGEKGVHIETRLEIRSPILARILKDTVGKYPGPEFKSLSGDKPAIAEPYLMIFHNWERLQGRLGISEGEEKEHLGFLLDTVKSQVPNAARTLESMKCEKLTTIHYHSVWLLYRPGTVVYRLGHGVRRALVVLRVKNCKQKQDGVWTPFSLDMRQLVFDKSGEHLEPFHCTENVPQFDGAVPVANLQYVPSGYLANEFSVKEGLIERGRRYWSYKGSSSYLEYDGDAWVKTLNDVSFLLSYQERADIYFRTKLES
jgi:hypothetical protein